MTPVEESLHAWHLLQRASGGTRHLVLNSLAWVMWVLSGSGYLASLHWPPASLSSGSYLGGLAVASLMGLCFFFQAILAHENRSREKRVLSPVIASAAVVFLCMLLCAAGFVLLLAIEHLPPCFPSRVAYCLLALACLLVATTSIHGLGGRLRFVARRQPSCLSSLAAAAVHTNTAPLRPQRVPQPQPNEVCAEAGRVRAAAAAAAAAGVGVGASEAQEQKRSWSSPGGGRWSLGGTGQGRQLRDKSGGGVEVEAACAMQAEPAALSAHSEASRSGGQLFYRLRQRHAAEARSAQCPTLDLDKARWGAVAVVSGDAVTVTSPPACRCVLASNGGRRSELALRATGGGRGLLSPVSTDEVAEGQEVAEEVAWRFWQPFRGGFVFVLTQALGWTLFAASFVYLGAMAKALVVAGATRGSQLPFLQGWPGTIFAGVLMFAAPSVLALSLLVYEGGKRVAGQDCGVALPESGGVQQKQPEQQQGQHLGRSAGLASAPGGWLQAGTQARARVAAALALVMPVILMYSPLHFYTAFWAVLLAIVPLWYMPGLWLAVHMPYYALTCRGRPQHTGCRRWPWLVDYFVANLEPSMRYCFGGFQVIRDFPDDPDPNQRYIFGFHPHGLYPTGAGLLPLSPSFRAAFPGILPVTLTASIVHWVPALRDIVMWAGMRQINRSTFISSLNECGSVLLCPGGQAELIYTHKLHLAQPQRELVIYAGHRGFLRLALQQDAYLVPVLALGEARQFRDAISAPMLQKTTYKWFGFPVPYCITGRWGFTPFPCRVPLVYVLGKPIKPEPACCGMSEEEAVELLHARFYTAMEELYIKYHHVHPDYCNASIRILSKHCSW